LHTLPERVRVVEVGPRDGLQNESTPVSLGDKVAFIEALLEAGCREIEVGAFVHPARVPQMADSERLVELLLANDDGSAVFWALVPNLYGLKRAINCGVRHVAVFTAASEVFAQRNIGMSIDQSLRVFEEVVREAARTNIRVGGYVSTAWWCPFSGQVQPAQVVAVAQALIDMGCVEVTIADTIGAATPGEVSGLLSRLTTQLPAAQLGVHFHNTRGTALANVLVALPFGIARVDASAGGIGGCPFAPGAQGNLATEELVYMLHGLGIDTDIEIDAVRQAALAISRALGREPPSRFPLGGADPRQCCP
jgi:hydroxymethylglutaryl-CoA lyase